MNIRSFGSGSACVSDPQTVAISQIIGLLTAIACKESSKLQMVSDCLTVIVAGAWGEVGDKIQVLRWFDGCQIPPESFISVYVNTVTNTIVTGLDSSNSEACANDVATWTTDTETVTRSTSSVAGSTTAGIFGLTITNIGTADGVVAGATLAIGQTVNLGAFNYNANTTVYLVPSVSYNGTGTILSITEVSS